MCPLKSFAKLIDSIFQDKLNPQTSEVKDTHIERKKNNQKGIYANQSKTR